MVSETGILIGKVVSGAHWAGMLSEVLIFPTALSPKTVAAIQANQAAYFTG